MAILDIIIEGDPRLRQKATKIRAADATLRRLASDMHETMLDAPGVGLAAPQVGITRRLIVVHVPENTEEEDEPATTLSLINPEIVRAHGEVAGLEGCLSIPGWIGEVPRAEVITVKAMDLDNRPVRIKARNYVARVLQHEIDHLDGILFIDRIVDKSTLVPVPPEDEIEGPVAESEVGGQK